MASGTRIVRDTQKIAYRYFWSSLILGPLTIYLGYALFTKGVGDACDSSYFLSNGAFDIFTRDAEFHRAQIFQVTGASLMIIVGLTILGLLVYRATKSQNHSSSYVLPAILTIIMILGYTLVIFMSGVGAQVC